MTVMKDGYQCLITFALEAAVKMWEKTAKPPGISGGGAIDITTMHNTAVRTNSPKSLYTVSESTLSVAWDPALYLQIIAMINKNQLITVTFPDTSTLAFYGWIDEFSPGDLEEGSQPMADITIIPTNLNASNVETIPAYTAPA